MQINTYLVRFDKYSLTKSISYFYLDYFWENNIITLGIKNPADAGYFFNK
ncbi:MAG: hypothetical protein LUB56_02205 [Coprobacillus sp.]|nr:hypothetical protein [Coprobacillus sp.]